MGGRLPMVAGLTVLCDRLGPGGPRAFVETITREVWPLEQRVTSRAMAARQFWKTCSAPGMACWQCLL